jgi:hypothetical protein
VPFSRGLRNLHDTGSEGPEFERNVPLRTAIITSMAIRACVPDSLPFVYWLQYKLPCLVCLPASFLIPAPWSLCQVKKQILNEVPILEDKQTSSLNHFTGPLTGPTDTKYSHIDHHSFSQALCKRAGITNSQGGVLTWNKLQSNSVWGSYIHTYAIQKYSNPPRNPASFSCGLAVP